MEAGVELRLEPCSVSQAHAISHWVMHRPFLHWGTTERGGLEREGRRWQSHAVSMFPHKSDLESSVWSFACREATLLLSGAMGGWRIEKGAKKGPPTHFRLTLWCALLPLPEQLIKERLRSRILQASIPSFSENANRKGAQPLKLQAGKSRAPGMETQLTSHG